MSRQLSILLVLVALAACSKPATPVTEADLSAQAVQEIMAADRAFNDMAKEKGTGPAFAEFMDATDGMMIHAGSVDPTKGRDAIFELQNDGIIPAPIVWAPVEGYASKGGDFGVTWGRWTYSGEGGDGAATKLTGKYTTVWRKNAEGQWKGLIDLGVRDPAPAAPVAPATPTEPGAPAIPAPPADNPTAAPSAQPQPAQPDGTLPPAEIMEPPGPTNPGSSLPPRDNKD